MAMTGETEIKLLASPAMLARLREAGPTTTALLGTTYFDSADRRLAQAGLSLRLRRQDGTAEATVKSRGAVRRGEWTVPVEGDLPRPDAFPARVHARLDKVLAGAVPAPVAGTAIERATRQVRHGGSLIDLAFDSGRIEAGACHEAVCEVELELVEGRLSDLLALAQTLPLGPDLRWSVLSKGDRCDLLARGVAPAPVHARALALSPDIDLAEAFQRVAWNCLDHLLANYLLVIATGDDEAIHQCRVAMRRLLAAWKAFGAHVADDRLPVLRAGLKAVGKTLGQSRDLFVLHQRLTEIAAGEVALLAEIARHEAEATRAAQDALASSSFQALLFDLAQWIEAGAWREGDTLGQPLAPFARRLLAKSRRKLDPGHTPLAALSVEALHQLRKRGKQLRYTARFFDGLWDDDRKHARMLDALGDLQDHLGAVHDADAANEAADTLFAEPGLAAHFRQLLDGDAGAREKHLRAASKALHKIRKS
jgi:triphosphatase